MWRNQIVYVENLHWGTPNRFTKGKYSHKTFLATIVISS